MRRLHLAVDKDKKPVKRRLVDFLHNSDDLRCITLGQLGLSTWAIARQTGLSECQVLYRLSKSKTRRADYRNGVSESSQFVMKLAVIGIARKIRQKLAKEGMAS